MNNLDQILPNILSGLLVVFVILLVIFLVCREIVCWYFKINQNVALLTEIRNLLAAKENLQAGAGSTTTPSETKGKPQFDDKGKFVGYLGK